MAQKPEGRFRQALGKALSAAGAFVQPIESGTTALGIPDMYGCHQAHCFWLELKAMEEVDWPNNRKVPFRPLQYRWGIKNADHGGISVVGIHFGNGFLFTMTRDIFPDTLKPNKDFVLFIPKLDGEIILQWIQEHY